MQFILTFTVPPETREAALARFLETGGQPPPAVRRLGRWTPLDLCGGVVWLESEDPKALTAFTHGWSDVLELTLAPVLADQDLADVLQRASVQPTQTDGRAEGAGLPQAAAIVADQELPERTPPEAVHGDLRAEDPAIAPSAGRRRTRRGPQARPEDPSVVPETTPGTPKPPSEEIA